MKKKTKKNDVTILNFVPFRNFFSVCQTLKTRRVSGKKDKLQNKRNFVKRRQFLKVVISNPC